MLKTVRVVLAWAFFLAITWLFLDFTGLAAAWFGWMAKIQVVPALLALNIVALAVVALLTVIFGRVYCSIICPLGVMQDGFTWLRGHVGAKKKRKNRFRFTPNKQSLRLGVAVVFLALLCAGGAARAIAALIAPYSAYGRIASSLLAPVYDLANNGMAAVAEAENSVTFYTVDGFTAWNPIVTLVAVVTLVVVGGFAFFKGRWWCNNICPVGTLLGYLSKGALYKIRIDTSKCINCGKCGRECKASCIDTKNHRVDYTRCVACMDCIGNCSTNAISYSVVAPKNEHNDDEHFIENKAEAPKPATKSAVKQAEAEVKEAEDNGRRQFMLTGLAVGAGAAVAWAQGKTTDGGLATLRPKHAPERKQAIAPPGAGSYKSFHDHCTRCQLCINQCPNGVLQPRIAMGGFMIPEMVFTTGYCRPECNRCSTVCPTGSIKLITPEERTAVSVGVASVDYDICLAAADGENCGNCARHCPADAIVMVEVAEGSRHKRPVVNPALCIGCGACEHLCPVSPVSAITVEGREVHTPVKPIIA